METLADGLKRALADATDVVVCYPDLMGLDYWAAGREKTLDAHARALISACAYRALVVPTFAWESWCEGGVWDRFTTPTELGTLNEWFRTHYSLTASNYTPVYRYSAITSGGWPSGPPVQETDPFGPYSFQAWCARRWATVLAYGSDLRTAGDFHLAERAARVPYRFVKRFKGTNNGKPSTLHYFVRHLEVEYDWDKLNAILIPCFRAHETVAGTVHTGRCDHIFDVLTEALRADEHAFLKRPPTELYERYGKPLTYEAVEGGS
jgi:aminoglycoside N3'-acetyltransferase